MSRLCTQLYKFFVVQRLSFKLNYWFIDDFHDPIELELEDVIEAEINQSLVNPFTGEIMYDYKSFVFPFFTLDESKLKDIV